MKEKTCIEFQTECDGKTIIIPEHVPNIFKGKVKVILIAENQENEGIEEINVKKNIRDIPLERDDIYER